MASQHQRISIGKKSPSFFSVVFPCVSSTSSDGATPLRSLTRRVPSPTPSPFPAQVIKNVATLFYDQPDLLHGKDGLEFFVPKTCKPPQPSQWFQWTVKTHNRFGRVSFRVAVRMLLLCEKRSRSQPPDLTKRKVRLVGAKGSRRRVFRLGVFGHRHRQRQRLGRRQAEGSRARRPRGASARVGRRDRADDVGVREDDAGDQAHERRSVLGGRQGSEGGEREERGGVGPGEAIQARPNDDDEPAGVAPAAGRGAAVEEIREDHREGEQGAMYTSYRHLSSGRHMNSGEAPPSPPREEPEEPHRRDEAERRAPLRRRALHGEPDVAPDGRRGAQAGEEPEGDVAHRQERLQQARRPTAWRG